MVPGHVSGAITLKMMLFTPKKLNLPPKKMILNNLEEIKFILGRYKNPVIQKLPYKNKRMS